MCLLCPVCDKPLYKYEHHYACEHNHSFDIAKQGYTNLLLRSSKHSGDDDRMVSARQSFLVKGFYEPLQEILCNLIATLNPKIVVDAGCGEGYYTNAIASASNASLFAFDISKKALKIAAKGNQDVSYFLASLFHLPIQKHSVDLILNIFAPLALDEFKDKLKVDGILIKVDPGAEHMWELKEVLYDHPYLNEVQINTDMVLMDQKVVKYKKCLQQEDIINLYDMTPYAYKSSKQSKSRLQTIQALEITFHFVIQVYKMS